VQSMAELQPPQVRQRKIVRKIFNTSVWNGQDDQGVDELTSILRCDEKPSMQQLERVRRCCSKTCVHQNRSAKIFKFGSKTPTGRGNGARQSACSTDDASALSDVSKEQHSDGKCIFEKGRLGSSPSAMTRSSAMKTGLRCPAIGRRIRAIGSYFQ